MHFVTLPGVIYISTHVAAPLAHSKRPSTIIRYKSGNQNSCADSGVGFSCCLPYPSMAEVAFISAPNIYYFSPLTSPYRTSYLLHTPITPPTNKLTHGDIHVKNTIIPFYLRKNTIFHFLIFPTFFFSFINTSKFT